MVRVARTGLNPRSSLGRTCRWLPVADRLRHGAPRVAAHVHVRRDDVVVRDHIRRWLVDLWRSEGAVVC